MNQSLDNIVRRVGEDWAQHSYYDLAETSVFLDQFWAERSIFRKEFGELSLGNIVELACGRGRHTAQIVGKFGQAILLDINESNILACRERFFAEKDVRSEINSGYDLAPVADGWADCIFSYDAMVHFEPDVVGSYISDAARVLKAGGQFLFHHSAYSLTPGTDYSENPHYRNYMTLELIRHYAGRAGFEIVSQHRLGWGGEHDYVSDIDGLTRLRKIG